MIYKILKTKEDIIITPSTLVPEIYNVDGDTTFGMLRGFIPLDGVFTLPANNIIESHYGRVNHEYQNIISFSNDKKTIFNEPVVFPEAFEFWRLQALEQGCIEQTFDSETNEISFFEFCRDL